MRDWYRHLKDFIDSVRWSTDVLHSLNGVWHASSNWDGETHWGSHELLDDSYRNITSWTRQCLVNNEQVPEIIRQKATSPSCHHPRWQMHSFSMCVRHARSPVVAGKQCAMHRHVTMYPEAYLDKLALYRIDGRLFTTNVSVMWQKNWDKYQKSGLIKFRYCALV